MAGDSDILQNLIGPEWRGVPFPLVRMRTSGSNDLVQHKHPDQDGFHVECTGANNRTIEAEIPFLNNLRPAPSEKWLGRTPYPELFRAFILACVDKTSGPLVHPEFGELNVKCERWSFELAPSPRDGAIVHVEWIESVDDGNFLGSYTQPSPVASAVALASQLDDQITELTPPPPELQEDPASFSDMMRFLQSVPDTATLLSKQVGGMFGRAAAKLDRLDEAMKRFNTVRWWPIVDGAEHLRASLFDMEKKFGVDQKVMREYIVRAPATLSMLAQILGQDVDAMIRLNRNFMSKPVVPAGARVKYYKVAA